MKLSGKGLCTIVSSSLLFVCAVSAVAVGFKCIALGSSVRAHFHLATAAGAFYSGHPGDSRAGPDWGGAGLLPGQSQVCEFLPLWDLSVSFGGPDGVLRRGGRWRHGVLGGEEVRALLPGLCGCKPGVRPAQGVPAGSGGFHYT